MARFALVIAALVVPSMSMSFASPQPLEERRPTVIELRIA